MTTKTVTEAKAALSPLLTLVEQGEEVIITRSGQAVAKLVSVASSAPSRKPGALKGKLRISADFDAAVPEFERSFYNGGA